MNFKSFSSAIVICASSFSLHSQNIPDGIWVGALDYGEIQCPIRFEISSQGLEMILINGDERAVFQIEKSSDSLLIPMKPFDAYISAKYSDDEVIRGTWNKPYRGISVSFSASMVSFKEGVISDSNAKIKLKMTFNPGENNQYPAVGVFDFWGERATGTVLTETGDFRYFEGTKKGDSMAISAFDGTHGFLLTGKRNDTEWSGEMHFEPGYSEHWTALEDDNAAISDPFEMVEVEAGTHKPYYDLLGAGSGKNAIDVSKYEGKVLIIQVFGTWCPNSLDQTNYLLDWYPQRPDGVEILAVTYEPNYSKEYGLRRINEYTSHLDIPYDMVLGGALSKSQAALPFPFLKRLEAFPTLVLVDKNGYARYVHSYFNGPATGDLYADFITEFNQKINELAVE